MKRTILGLLALALVAGACSRAGASAASITVGAVYPLSGSQGSGGVDEYRGVRLAADMTNATGGVQGRLIRLDAVDVPGSDAARVAIDQLAGRGIRFVLGSYGSTISLPAAQEADRKGMLFWETGAVGEMSGVGAGSLSFRVSPTGQTLGRTAVDFISNELAPKLGRMASTLRFAVANVDDVYGSAVAAGAVAQIRALGLPYVGQFRYTLPGLDVAGLVSRIVAAKPDVLFVAAYVDDGVALRREMVRQHLRLVANIGTSSSYCMPAFGAALGPDAVGLFASDKPDGYGLNTKGLLPGARALAERAEHAYESTYHQDMSAPALAGFSNAWALFHWVMPGASSLTPADVAASALRLDVPQGSLPNGSGIRFVRPGNPGAGSNSKALSVIWEWVKVRTRAVVWPPRFATEQVLALPIAS
jgi:branched-chain amino acid transport system substrate-binding protein